MREKKTQKQLIAHYNYILNRYRRIESELADAYEDDDVARIFRLENILADLEDELADAKASINKY